MFEVHPSWQTIINRALKSLDNNYLKFLEKNNEYFPAKDTFLNAFKTLPLDKTKYILFGQDPYPRKESATGYAFIDGAVSTIWDKSNGLSKQVNKATSLRNFIKMLLICNRTLSIKDTSKQTLAKINTETYIQSILELKNNFEKNGVLLLNSAFIFTKKEDSKKHIKMWIPFVDALLHQIKEQNIKLILFGNLAKQIDKLTASKSFDKFYCEHPYNVSFITNEKVQSLFKEMKLLDKY